MSNKHNSVFISYRREASSFMARAIFQDLRAHDYDVFMDVERLDAGNFDTIILNQIRARTHFLVLLAPGTLERCADPNDWLRREIETALEADRNVILLLAEHFNLKQDSQYLTGKLADLPRRNGIPVPHYFFDAAMEKLRTRFLIEQMDIDLANVPPSDAAVVERKMAEAETEPPVQQEDLSAEAYFNQGVGKAIVKDYQGAIENWSKAIHLQSDYPTAYYNRGIAYAALGQYETAIKDFDQVIRRQPDDAETYYNRGLAHNALGQHETAIRDYDQAIHLQPDYANAYRNRGVTYEDMHYYQKAIEDFQYYIDLNGTEKEVAKGWIEKLKKRL